MSTIAKEWLQQKIAEMEATRDEIPFGLDEDDSKTLAALRIALASLEAEAVGYLDAEYAELLKSGHIESCSVYAESGEGWIALYAAPPAPLSVPDDVSWEDVPEEITEDDMALASAWAHGFNQCRAAMLQCAKNAESRCTMKTAPALDSSPENAESRCSNSPVIPDGGEHGFCHKHPDTRRLTHPYKQLSTYPPRP
ncbi:DUF551 domain-containing protein [Enterobacter sp. BNK-16]|uniref:DUF551 domain-containing protein n=1 Tax=Enterobacter sp. BNK-16 TaxID=3376153 RepID=UPI003B501776